MFGKGLITGMGITIRHFFGKKATFCYPEEKLTMTEHFRGGHLTIDYKKCIACQLCAIQCPNQAIKLKVVTDANRKRHLESYVHSMGRCLYCDLCIEGCAPHALSWDKDYEISTWHKEDLVHQVMTDEDRSYLAEVMTQAAANPTPPPVPKAAPKPAAAAPPAAKPADTEVKPRE
ncbi:MAG: 4Fe-4S dicluster domain-containing protein [Schwartzia sp.]|nr:4Fe-4S dicluster domain-containing protein [Schwartzia sp. (in: firmicutes)]